MQLAEFVRQEYGLNFTKKLVSLQIKTQARLNDLECTYAQYSASLRMDMSERERLMELLTVHETYFFREDHHLRELSDIIVPMVLNSTKCSPIRIWSAACSTGEEPYSIAMVLYEKLGRRSQHVQILASDIDKKTLTKAIEGRYPTRSFTFRRTPEAYLNRFFDKEDTVFRVKNEIRQMVEFHQLNLLDAKAMQRFGDMDAIFCRNVLIYFDEEGKQRVIRALYDGLKPNGYLFMGHAESIQHPTTFQTIRAPGTFYYQKGAGGA